MKGKDFSLLISAMVMLVTSVATWKYGKTSGEPDYWRGASILSLFVLVAIVAYAYNDSEAD